MKSADSTKEEVETPPISQEEMHSLYNIHFNSMNNSNNNSSLSNPTNGSAPIIPKTVTNNLGIMQNPTGFHNGQRVWGGGIVKYNAKNMTQWQPWPMDLDEGKDNLQDILIHSRRS